MQRKSLPAGWRNRNAAEFGEDVISVVTTRGMTASNPGRL